VRRIRSRTSTNIPAYRLPGVRDPREGGLSDAIVESSDPEEPVDLDAAGWQLSR
jgi:hypothetical protein